MDDLNIINIAGDKRQIQALTRDIDAAEWQLHSLYAVRTDVSKKIDDLKNAIEHKKQSIADIHKTAFDFLAKQEEDK